MDNTENNFANNISAAAKKYLTMIYPVYIIYIERSYIW